MAEVRVENPELHTTLKADSRGRVSLGSKYADKDVTVIVEKIIEDEDNS